MAGFDTYRDRFANIALRREDGVVELAIHGGGGAAKWTFGPDGLHRQLGDAFRAIGEDPEARVLIVTGTGELFLTELDFTGLSGAMDGAFVDRIYDEGKALLLNLLDIPFPVIGAVNGDAFIHAEIPILSDIVLAAEGARLADKAHFVGGAVPGDGVHTIWPMLLGPNRGRYFLLTGEEIDAAEAKRLGVVGEVLSRDALMPRAWALARDIAAKPRALTRYTRQLLVHELRRRLFAELSHGLALESLAPMVG